MAEGPFSEIGHPWSKEPHRGCGTPSFGAGSRRRTPGEGHRDSFPTQRTSTRRPQVPAPRGQRALVLTDLLRVVPYPGNVDLEAALVV